MEIAGNAVSFASPANPNFYSPISGLVGHTFIRLCLWFDLVSSWKKRTYARPSNGFLNFPDSEMEPEVVPHAAAS